MLANEAVEKPANRRFHLLIDAVKHAAPRKEYLDSRKPLVKLVEELGRKRLGHVYIRKGDFSLSAGRSRYEDD